MKTIKIPELNIEVETKIHNKGDSLKEALKDKPKDWRLLTYDELQWLRNNKYKNKLNLIDTWEFVKQPDNIAKKNGYIARFFADSVKAVLVCFGRPDDSNSSLGVRFCKDIKGENK